MHVRHSNIAASDMDLASMRPLLFSIAYRMLGSAADAEDMVQETYLRVRSIAPDSVENPRAYLSTIVTRLCIDHLRSARVRKEFSGGVRLPELVAEPKGGESTITTELADSLSIAFVALLQRLSPIERAAYLLHEVFDFDYPEISRIIGKTADNSRQIVSRARKALGGGKARFEASSVEVHKIVERFVRTARSGDFQGLFELLAPEVVLYADGGAERPRYGRIRALLKPLRGRDQVAKFLMMAQSQAARDTQYMIGMVNSAPAIISILDGRPIGVVSFDIYDGKIQNLFIIADPAKLRALDDLP
jgi:RNA polymerase sigma-70 factor, ECF subfamily